MFDDLDRFVANLVQLASSESLVVHVGTTVMVGSYETATHRSLRHWFSLTSIRLSSTGTMERGRSEQQKLQMTRA